MTNYLFRRLAFLLLTLLLTSLIVFLVTQLLPGDVARVVLGREAGEAALAAFREANGLNDPWPQQYGRWLGNFVTGDWGTSLATRTEIYPTVMQRVHNSLMLAGLTMAPYASWSSDRSLSLTTRRHAKSATRLWD